MPEMHKKPSKIFTIFIYTVIKLFDVRTTKET